MPAPTTILHLIDARHADSATLALIATSLDGQAQALLLAGQALADVAPRAGLRNFGRLGTPFGRPLLNLPALHRRLNRYPEVTILHCWSIDTLAAAALLRPNLPKVLSLTSPVPPSPRELRRLMRIIRHQPRRLRIAVTHEWVRQALIEAIPLTVPAPQDSHGCSSSQAGADGGADGRRDAESGGEPEGEAGPGTARLAEKDAAPTRLAEIMTQTVSAGIELAGPPGEAPTRIQIRAKLGIDDDLPLIALLSDPPAGADARMAGLVASLVGESRSAAHSHVARTRLDPRILVCPTQYRRPQAKTMMRGVGADHILIQTAGAAYPWWVLPACDAALAIGPTAGGLSLAWAMCLGVPIIAENRPAVAEQVQHDQHALLSAPDEAKSLAHNLERVLEDHDLAARLADAARNLAERRHAPRSYRRTLGHFYQLLRQPAWSVINCAAAQPPIPPSPLNV